MSEQDDLDDNDKLFILLASMKEYREAIANDKKRLEQFYNHVASDVLDKAEKSLQSTNKRAMDALNKSIQELNTATGRLDWKFMAVYASTFVALVMAFILALFIFVPSMDEIQERRTEVSKLKEYSLDISKCDGKTCVKVMTKQCGYGKTRIIALSTLSSAVLCSVSLVFYRKVSVAKWLDFCGVALATPKASSFFCYTVTKRFSLP